MKPHPYRLRPYHNPERVDESKVPVGWRFRYADEAGKKARTSCITWIGTARPPRWSGHDDWPGRSLVLTYIVPVDA